MKDGDMWKKITQDIKDCKIKFIWGIDWAKPMAKIINPNLTLESNPGPKKDNEVEVWVTDIWLTEVDQFFIKRMRFLAKNIAAMTFLIRMDKVDYAGAKAFLHLQKYSQSQYFSQYLSQPHTPMGSFSRSKGTVRTQRCQSISKEYGIQCELGMGHRGEHEANYLPKYLTKSIPEGKKKFKISWENPHRKLMKRNKPFVGWRCWRLHTMVHDWRYVPEIDKEHLIRDAREYYLMSTAIENIWEGPVCRTKGNKRVSPITPHNYNFDPETEDWGVFSYKSPELLLSYFSRHIMDTDSLINTPVIGRLDITGHTIEHELGFRSQVATIQELWFVYQNEGQKKQLDYLEKITDSLSSRYECPVKLIEKSRVSHWASYLTEEWKKENEIT